MNEILALLKDYGNKSVASSQVLHPNALACGLSGGALERDPLASYLGQRGAVDCTIVRIDMISPHLAYVQVAYPTKSGHRGEILGLIKVTRGWQLVSLLWGDNADAFSNLYPDRLNRQSGDAAALYDMLMRYCDAVYNLDAKAALALFFSEDIPMEHPVAGGEMAYVPISVLHDRWHDLEHPSKSGIGQFSRIFHVEMINADTAFAKLGVSKLHDHYNDYISCIKLDGRWLIVNKMTELLMQK